MENETLHKAKKHRDYWISRAQELQSNPHKLAEEILDFTRQEVKNCSISAVVKRSGQLSFTDDTMPPMGSKKFDCSYGLCECKQNCKT